VDRLRHEDFLVKNLYFRLFIDSGIYRLVRSGEPFASADAMEESCEPVNQALDDAGRATMCLLIDSRDAPARNDPAYERMFQPQRVRMSAGLKRAAVLTRSVVGKLQTARLLRETDAHGSHIRVFTDEKEALEYLRTGR
jgi:hypothetical protein